jgi:hypothetical protein
LEDADQEIYRDLLADLTRNAEVEVGAYWTRHFFQSLFASGAMDELLKIPVVERL